MTSMVIFFQSSFTNRMMKTSDDNKPHTKRPVHKPEMGWKGREKEKGRGGGGGEL